MTLTINSTQGIDWNATGVEQLKNNILNIIRTRLGEVPYMPTLGISPEYIDTAVTLQRAKMVADVRQQLQRWESRAKLDNLDILPNEDGNYTIKVVISF